MSSSSKSTASGPSAIPKTTAAVVAPYGKWKSPITSDLIVQQNISFGEIRSFYSVVREEGDVDQSKKTQILWTENRPQEKGRAALIRASFEEPSPSLGSSSPSSSSPAKEQDLPHTEQDLAEGKYNARSGVHEYGGGVIGVGSDKSVIFTDYDPAKWDVYRLPAGAGKEAEAEKISPDNPAHRFAVFAPHPTIPHLILCILEDHTNDTPSTVLNSLVLLDAHTHTISNTPIVSGADFYAYPSFSPDGQYISWVQWNHPSMPWWDTEVRVAKFDLNTRAIVGEGVAVKRAQKQGSGDDGEAVQQPRWMPAFGDAGRHELYFTSDRTGFANLYSVDVQESGRKLELSEPRLVAEEILQEDMHQPAWVLSVCTYAFLSPTAIAAILLKGGSDTLALLNPQTRALLRLSFNFTFKTFEHLHATSAQSIVVASGSDDNPGAIVQIQLAQALEALGRTKGVQGSCEVKDEDVRVVKRTSNVVKDGLVGQEWLGPSEEIEFPTTLPNGAKSTAYAVIFPPYNPNYTAPAGTSSPCRITVHGGPTSSAQGGMDLETAFWTSRGWMVCAVNYGGSTGYGREYMNRMIGEWGVVDVEDCVAAARYLGSADSGKDAARKQKASGSAKGKGNAEGIYQSPTAKKQAALLTETRLPDGTTEVALLNHEPDWKLSDALIGTGLAALGLFFTKPPGMLSTASFLAGAGFWLASKLFKVQEEVVKAIPGLGLQQETRRGVRAPWSDQPGAYFPLSSSVHLTPRDRIVDLVVNEVLRGWGVETYVTAITTSEKLTVLFPNTCPRLPLIPRIYQALYPALLGSNPASTSSASALPLADPNKIVISGGSSGGYTVLAALCLHPKVFSAACSRYGISELTALAADSHKFESRYPLRLLGGSPEEVPEIYHNRSPLYMADRIVAPVLIEQGDLDKVVPPNQSEGMVETIRRNGGADRVKYILFEGEGHGFRQAANKKRALEEELKWYEEVFHM